MGMPKHDAVSLAQVRARFSELVQEVKAGAETIITKDGEPHVALIATEQLAHYHRLAHERIHLLLIDEARGGLEDVAFGRVKHARGAIRSIKRHRL
jgi:prevent-host-death family protein